MHEEYDILKLTPRKNPYVKMSKKQASVNHNNKVIMHFKNQSDTVGIFRKTE